ncbi:MAG: DUF6132 family protein [Ignavibacteria bacterium]|nr:DUF6132 family protein [Ignavibacteria bacterium]
MKMIVKKYWKSIVFSIVGGILGFAYYYFIGCNSGSCPITSKWYTSTLYGILLGFVISLPSKKEIAKIDGE